MDKLILELGEWDGFMASGWCGWSLGSREGNGRGDIVELGEKWGGTRRELRVKFIREKGERKPKFWERVSSLSFQLLFLPKIWKPYPTLLKKNSEIYSLQAQHPILQLQLRPQPAQPQPRLWPRGAARPGRRSQIWGWVARADVTSRFLKYRVRVRDNDQQIPTESVISSMSTLGCQQRAG